MAHYKPTKKVFASRGERIIMKTFDELKKIKLENGYTYTDLSGFETAKNADFLSKAKQKYFINRNEKIKIYEEVKKFEEKSHVGFFDSVKIFDVVKIGNSCTIGDYSIDYDIYEVTIFEEEDYIFDFEYALQNNEEDLPNFQDYCYTEYIINENER